MDKDQIKELLLRYESGTCTAEEKALLETWFLKQHAEKLPSPSEIESDLNEVWAELNQNYHSKSTIITWYRVAAAAITLLFLSVAGFFLTNRQQPVQRVAQVQQHDALPGSNKAILTLANGRKIILNDKANGKLAEQSGIKITKTANGQITYTIANVKTPYTNVATNTIEVPPGGQYRVKLPDGTNVWLNAATTLRYPVRFTGNERRVELNGEAYFEVVHNKAMPFRVINARQTVEVLGTHFSVMAYGNEAVIKTTLLEGSVKVSDATRSTMLIPGQQSQLTREGINVVSGADVDNAIAWVKGKLQFTDSDIQSIMRTLSRWYDIDVQYTDTKITKRFGGSFSRSKNLSVVLKALQSTGDVHFLIEGRRVIIMP
ncbi:FecR family protein [Mucilaginibacter boryungensis]|uniref:DUF4974 domain-containing protein n=1 Tax=Mucilaginibacter boryungensis TaxID=768480 RepID=A0ABR9XDC5_9SPHI|nr:FecR domain-containing protein [Mucilaginibacter boryungensis]MBE9665399.1 DUF4974 domain-containing protein [Mucilaginibacter boryungensis]